MSSVSGRKKLSAFICDAIVMPRKIVTRFASTFCAVSERELSTPHSRIRFPNIRNPMSDEEAGTTAATTTVMTIGKSILVRFETVFCSYGIRMRRSFFVVRSLIIGG